MAEVPLSVNGGGITDLFDQFPQSHFVRVQSVARVGAEGTMDADAIGVTACEEGGAGCGTNWLSDVKVGEADAFAGHFVEVRSLDPGGAIDAEVGVALIVCKDNDDVWGWGW
jgi:hypothetical protein